ncbi:MAG: amidohydrolase family protein [Candidatus Geothermarchaeales archaeon]
MTLDLVIKSGRIIDGSGNPWFRGDVGVKGGVIVKIGSLTTEGAEKTVEAKDLAVTPGFIDIHSHADTALLANPKAESIVMQGITTTCIGNCGLSAAPVRDPTKQSLKRYLSAFMPVSEVEWHTLGDFLSRLERQGTACNVAALVGHGTVRVAVMGFEARPPERKEMEEMKRLIAQSMEEGAFGVSTGLAYAPGFFSTTEEVVELCGVVARYGGIYATHIRSDGETYGESVKEAIEVSERSGVPLQISHIESHYPNWGKASEALGVVDAARERGIDVSCDVPPYLLGMTMLTTLLPDWAQEGGFPRMIERLSSPKDREEMRKSLSAKGQRHVMASASLAADGHWDKIWIAESEKNPDLVGKNLEEASRLRGEAPHDAVFDLLQEEGKNIKILCEFHDEEDLRRVVKHPTSMIVSDESAYAAREASQRGRTHPRAYGAFPMTLRKYVRGETRREMPEELGESILAIQEAVRKMTSLPAQRLGLRDRGMIREGMWADLVVFDPETIGDEATYQNPHRYPRGIEYVFVNGVAVVERDEHTGALPGKVLRGPGYLTQL